MPRAATQKRTAGSGLMRSPGVLVTTSMNRLNLIRKKARTTATATAKKSSESNQLRLDILPQTKQKCPDCGMEFLPMLVQDTTLHRAYHEDHIRGPLFQSGAPPVATISAGRIIRVDVSSRPGDRAAVDKLLDMANRELGAPRGNDAWNGPLGRGAVFVCVSNGRALGFVSVERVSRASLADPVTGELRANTLPASMGVSRLYVAPQHRHRGIALALVRAAATSFVYGLRVSPARVAWTQPTTGGSRVALRFCPRDDGFVLVYDERSLAS